MKSIRPKDDLPKDLIRPGYFIVDDALWDQFLAHLQTKLTKPVEEISIIEHDIDAFRIDGGGMVHLKDPELEFKIQECRVLIYGRQVEFVLSSLRTTTTRSLGIEYVRFGGRWWRYILSKETAAAIADSFEKQARERKDEIDGIWKKMEKDVGEVKGAFAPTREQARKAYNEIDRHKKFKDN
jgi:hypothetical protein